LLKCKELSLVENVGKERINGMISREVLFEDEQFINVIEESMEERGQHVRLAV
jgi:hypothetical protein